MERPCWRAARPWRGDMGPRMENLPAGRNTRTTYYDFIPLVRPPVGGMRRSDIGPRATPIRVLRFMAVGRRPTTALNRRIFLPSAR